MTCAWPHPPRPESSHARDPPPPRPQLTKRYEAIVRVCQTQAGDRQRARNVGDILEKERAMAQAAGAGATA